MRAARVHFHFLCVVSRRSFRSWFSIFTRAPSAPSLIAHKLNRNRTELCKTVFPIMYYVWFASRAFVCVLICSHFPMYCICRTLFHTFLQFRRLLYACGLCSPLVSLHFYEKFVYCHRCLGCSASASAIDTTSLHRKAQTKYVKVLHKTQCNNCNIVCTQFLNHKKIIIFLVLFPYRAGQPRRRIKNKT